VGGGGGVGGGLFFGLLGGGRGGQSYFLSGRVRPEVSREGKKHLCILPKKPLVSRQEIGLNGERRQPPRGKR